MFPTAKVGVSSEPHYNYIFWMRVRLIVGSEYGGPKEASKLIGFLVYSMEPFLVFLSLPGLICARTTVVIEPSVCPSSFDDTADMIPSYR
jgi:hypothetical protein